MRPSCRSFATILFLWTLFGTRGDILTAKRTTSKNQCSETQKVACAPGVCRLAPRTQPEAYTCDCGETAYLDRRFSPGADPPFNISCKPLPFDPCQACHPKHTIVCKQLSDSQTVCECYGEFSQSTNCHKLKNGCEEVPLGASLSGNTACRTENGNLCLPNLGTLDYTCVCLQPYRASKGHNFPNCMGEAQSRCDDQLCVGFNPTGGRGITPRRVTVASEVIEVPEDERGVCLPKNGSCHCPPNWYNAHCTFRRGELKSGSWTPWSPCHPDCLETSGSGSFRVGFRVSQALCSTQDDWRRCQGHFKTWRRCSIEKVCTDAEEDGVRVAGRVSPEVAREAAWVLRKHTEEKVSQPRIYDIILTALWLSWH